MIQVDLQTHYINKDYNDNTVANHTSTQTGTYVKYILHKYYKLIATNANNKLSCQWQVCLGTICHQLATTSHSQSVNQSEMSSFIHSKGGIHF